VRGILEQDYGVSPADITWVRGGMDTPGRPEKLKLDLPADIRIEEAAEGGTLNQMLIDGDIDGFIGPRWPRCFDEGHPQLDCGGIGSLSTHRPISDHASRRRTA
jgi:4,5-dihydroxyphthalate decarboxylase